ncbi:ABC transporter substrate-binding protein [Bradyrhizobium sp. S3.9.1]|uniref:ABC transporter substrate-binding protein n=1 Tax=Bradyrhizobium sp. S3.9.1 TaxID=3156431 RepID=UPI003392F54F
MVVDRRRLIVGASIAAAVPAFGLLPIRRAAAQSGAIKIGVLTDLSGPFSSMGGPGSVACTKQAATEFANRGAPIEVLTADHQNRPDIAVNIARHWFDVERVNAIVDLTSSTIALAVNGVAREKNGVLLASGPATSALTGQAGSPNTIHWTYNDVMLAASAASAVRDGRDRWFFITSDTRAGSDLEKYTTAFIVRAGGAVVGSFRVPIDRNIDLLAQLDSAQRQSRAVALATVPGHTETVIRQISELGSPNATIVALQLLINDVHALGLSVCQKALLTETFYWDLNERTRQFSSRIQQIASHNQQEFKPNMVQAGCYSAVRHYLKAAFDLGVDRARASGRDVVARMKAMPVDDDVFGSGKVRDDGRKIHPAYLFEVKSPSQSRGAWDYYRPIRTISAEEAFGLDPITGCKECGDGCRCQNTCTCQKSCCPN